MPFKYILGVVGKNIAYSKSPFIHSAFAQAEGLSVSYTLEDVGAQTFAAKIRAMQKEGFYGCNITVPFKEQAFLCADMSTVRAKQAGAVNTFSFREGKIYGDNTDGLGLIRDLTKNLNYSLKSKSILICGAGGAARGILGPLMEEAPAAISLANRSLDKAEALATEFSSSSLSLAAFTYAQLAGQNFDLILDATSLKMESLPLSESLNLNPGSLVYDLKYNPEQETSIMQWGKGKGARVYDGIGMLVEQAAEAFNIWTGRMPNTRDVIKLIYEKFYHYS